MGEYVQDKDWLYAEGRYGRHTYTAYVPHPLAGWSPTLDASGVAAVADASDALRAIAAGADDRAATAAVLGQWMAARDESIRSSIIEGVGSTAEGLAWAHYRARSGQPVSGENDALTLGASLQVNEAVALGRRMRAGHPCAPEDILGLHSTLFNGTRDEPIGGRLRDGPIWVGPSGATIDAATFVAPPTGRVPDLLADLVGYMNNSEHHGALQAAVVHVQFETIHPFDDGNGRTGRALIQTILNARGLADGALPLSGVLEAERRSYYAALGEAQRVVCARDDHAARSAGLRRWLELFGQACVGAEAQAQNIARSLRDMRAAWSGRASFRAGSAASRLLTLLPSMPVLDSEMVAGALNVDPKTARSALRSLERAGIVKATGGSRNRRFTVPEVIAVLRGLSPDGAQPQPSSGAVGSASAAQTGCSHTGTRSRTVCILPAGHAGHHRYSP